MLHGRNVRHLGLSGAAVTLPDAPADPARLLDFSRAVAASADPPPAAAAASRDALAATPHELLLPASDERAASADGASTAGRGPLVDTAAATDAADVYGWAVAMLTAWLGRCPFAALERDELAGMLRNGMAESWLQVAVDEAEGLDGNLKGLLKVRPETRGVHVYLPSTAPLRCRSAFGPSRRRGRRCDRCTVSPRDDPQPPPAPTGPLLCSSASSRDADVNLALLR